ncbi:hypothetical protein [Chitinilyticum litopenaei]|uniref:hypothetical protein n=1 Tax=Chitinilyticum litopenaei TaxID=1121276 RepID=UPI0003F62B0D|nr:hypothetical protein [Chitinilyticum litopenaei]
MRLMPRLMLFLYSPRNIAGSIAALCVLALFFAGVVRNWWLPLTLGAYLSGWLLLPRATLPLPARLQGLPPDEAMDVLCRECASRLPGPAMARLEAIRAQLHELAPRLQAMPQAGTAALELSNAVTRDLPATLHNYLALPPRFASQHPLRDGKTAAHLLDEQLALLQDELAEISVGIFSQDADRLLSHGQYLQQKFQPYSFLEH